jgi:phage terminase large subunit
VFSDKRGTGQSIADMWRSNGLNVVRAKNQRVAGWANVRQYLWDGEKPNLSGTVGGPRLYIFDTCTNLARTLPLMQHSKHNQEDLDTHLEDHAVDALRYLLSVRPMNEIQRRRIPAVGADQKWAEMLRKLDKRPRRNTWK